MRRREERRNDASSSRGKEEERKGEDLNEGRRLNAFQRKRKARRVVKNGKTG